MIVLNFGLFVLACRYEITKTHDVTSIEMNASFKIVFTPVTYLCHALVYIYLRYRFRYTVLDLSGYHAKKVAVDRFLPQI